MSMSSDRSWIMLTSCEQRGGERPTERERDLFSCHLSLQQQQRGATQRELRMQLASRRIAESPLQCYTPTTT